MYKLIVSIYAPWNIPVVSFPMSYDEAAARVASYSPGVNWWINIKKI
jgi:hypothetical protein